MTEKINTTMDAPAKEIKRRLPPWLVRRLPSGNDFSETKQVLEDLRLNTVCVEAVCPNIWECWSHHTATFMILGNVCTRRCTFCAVAGGRPDAVDPEEPQRLAKACQEMGLKHVVITSVDRDDLPEGGATQFLRCIEAIRGSLTGVTIETLTPDFHRCEEQAIKILSQNPPEAWAHNIETVPRLYPEARRGSNYKRSLNLLHMVNESIPGIITKSGMMLGLGETREEVLQVLSDLRDNKVTWITLGQYLQPGKDNHPVIRFLPPEEFVELGSIAKSMGFERVQSSPFTRSSYHSRL